MKDMTKTALWRIWAEAKGVIESGDEDIPAGILVGITNVKANLDPMFPDPIATEPAAAPVEDN